MKTSYQKRLDEIAELKSENDELKKAVTEKATVLFHSHAWLGHSCDRYGYVDSHGNVQITAVV